MYTTTVQGMSLQLNHPYYAYCILSLYTKEKIPFATLLQWANSLYSTLPGHIASIPLLQKTHNSTAPLEMIYSPLSAIHPDNNVAG